MSNILFLTSVYDFYDHGHLNVDLVDEFARNGHHVTVMTPKERKYNLSEKKDKHGNITCLQFKCLNFRGKVNIIEKGISTLTLGFQYKKAYQKYFSTERYDLVIYTTLPITYSPILQYLKKKCDAFCYLQQKDFFPQSAVDLGLLKKGSLIYRLFRHIEIQLFKDSDKIGVMSPKNIEFITKNNPWLPAQKVEVCPNGIIPTTDKELSIIKSEKRIIRRNYNIPVDSVVFLYGGNISRAQGIPFIKTVLTELTKHPVPNTYFLFVGSGNEYDELEKHIKSLNNQQIKIMPYVPKNEFDKIIGAVDVGMVFLDSSFTIANIPSRTLAHMDMEQPIIAATDDYTDYREIIEKNELGLWCLSGDIKKMINNIKILSSDELFRKKCGINSRLYLLNNSNAKLAYSIIMNSYFKRKQID